VSVGAGGPQLAELVFLFLAAFDAADGAALLDVVLDRRLVELDDLGRTLRNPSGHGGRGGRRKGLRGFIRH
jgi:hypothetical protein